MKIPDHLKIRSPAPPVPRAWLKTCPKTFEKTPEVNSPFVCSLYFATANFSSNEEFLIPVIKNERTEVLLPIYVDVHSCCNCELVIFARLIAMPYFVKVLLHTSAAVCQVAPSCHLSEMNQGPWLSKFKISLRLSNKPFTRNTRKPTYLPFQRDYPVIFFLRLALSLSWTNWEYPLVYGIL